MRIAVCVLLGACLSATGAAAQEAQVEPKENVIEFVVADRDILPIVRVEPEFPRSARRAGIEGSCEMTFTVLENGEVDAASIVTDCTHADFVSSAERAVARWKYYPKIVDGQPVRQPDVTTSLTFSLAH